MCLLYNKSINILKKTNFKDLKKIIENRNIDNSKNTISSYIGLHSLNNMITPYYSLEIQNGKGAYAFICLTKGQWNNQLETFEQNNFLSEAKKGNAYFIHLLLPHKPHLLDENCSHRINNKQASLKKDSTVNIMLDRIKSRDKS